MAVAILALAAAYLLGSIPFGLLLGWLAGKDVRQEGSGNIGATNVGRVCGWRWGAPVFALDLFKGFAAVFWMAPWFMGQLRTELWRDSPWLAVASGLMVILGHNFPLWLRFRGGKGVATSAGVLLALMPLEFIAALAAFALVVSTSRYVSLGSLAAAAILPTARACLALWRDRQNPFNDAQIPFTLAAFAMCALVFIRHRANIRRLLAGTENRLGRGAGQAAAEEAGTLPKGETKP